jgi:dephospho-CoA kinase
MKIVGIVGGIASGKSSAAKIFKEHGAALLSGDEIGHQILGEPEIVTAAEERWGSGVIDQNGEIDRHRLAAIVFSEKEHREELTFLEKLTHPRIKSRLLAEIDRLRTAGTGVVILDAALLLETGWYSMCEKIVFIDASEENREKYAAQRNWTKEELICRESQQLSLEKKRAAADFQICNNGSMELMRQEISRVWDSLQETEMAD